MARGVNKVILIGNLGADPEVRYTASQKPVCNIRMATTRSWNDRQTNERRDETEWHRVVLFGRQAEVAAEYLRKGSQCYIEGRLQTRKWQDQSGQDRYTTEIVCEDMQLLGGRDGGTAAFGGSSGRSSQASNQDRGQDRGQGSSVNDSGGMPPMGDFDDDIPF